MWGHGGRKCLISSQRTKSGVTISGLLPTQDNEMSSLPEPPAAGIPSLAATCIPAASPTATCFSLCYRPPCFPVHHPQLSPLHATLCISQGPPVPAAEATLDSLGQKQNLSGADRAPGGQRSRCGEQAGAREHWREDTVC